MEQNNQNVECVILNTTPEQFYNINNDKCPVCQQKFIGLSNVYIQYGVGVHLNCHIEAAGIHQI